ncbi:MAG: YcnI family protein [Mycobacteriales bacterium]
MSVARPLVPVAGALALLLVPLAGPAAAHVTVQGPGATQGGFTKLTFRAPTEKDAPTTKLEIAFPAEHPIASVRVKPQPGWTYTMTKGAPSVPLEQHGAPVTEVVQRITWTVAAGNKGIGPTEFGEFEVSAGRLPEVDQLVFKALQTYADGEVVRWIEEPVEGGEEPEKPAPVLELAPAEEDGDSGAAASTEDSELTPAAAVSDAETDDVLSVVALVVAGLAFATGIAAFLRTRRSPNT